MKRQMPQDLDRIKKVLKQHKPLLREKYRVKGLSIFGSYVKNKARNSSDLDILVEFTEPVSLFEFIRTERFLGTITGLKVDLVMKDALKARIGRCILEEAEAV